MDNEMLDLDDLAALLDEDDDELFALVDGATGDPSETGIFDSTKSNTPHKQASQSSATGTGLHVQESLVSGSQRGKVANNGAVVVTSSSNSVSNTTGTCDRAAVGNVESDLVLSDDEAQSENTPSADEDDPTQSKIRALEAQLAKLKQKKRSKSSPKSLHDVIGKIKKPPTPNKSQLLDTTGLVASTVVRQPSADAAGREQRVRAMLRPPASHVHSGDTDSSDDDDNRSPFETKYNEFGRAVKRLAHQEASGGARDQLQERAESINRAAQLALQATRPARRADGGRPAEPEQPHQQVMLDSYGRMSVVNPRLTVAELRDCMQEKRLIRISQLEGQIRGETIPGDWVTIGVIARKSDPRTSQKGSAYSSWTLTDLIDCQKPLKVMLFGDAHASLWKTTVGTVVALANTKVMKEKEMHGSGVSVALNSKQHCIILGTSPDLDFCKAKCKNGRICLSFINKRQCPVCVFHTNAEYKKTGAKRGELQGSSSVTPRLPMKSQLGAGSSLVHDTQLSGGQLARHSNSAAQRLKDRQSLAKLRLNGQSEDKVDQKKKLSTLGLKHISEVEARAITDVAEKSVEMGEMLLKPCAGSRNFLKHLTKDCDSPSTDVTEARPAKHGAPRGDPKALLQAEAASRHLPAPRLARHVAPGQTVDLAGEPPAGWRSSAAATVGKTKALALLRRSGNIRKADPNSVRHSPSENSRQKVLKRLPENVPGELAQTAAIMLQFENNDLSSDNVVLPATKRSRLEDDPKFRAVLKARSSHAAALEAELLEGQEQYFQALEKKEMIENHMLNTWEIKTKAVLCRKCKYLALSASDLCKSEGHATTLVDAVKRFFSCKNCKNRTTSLDKLPKRPCTNCGHESWLKAPMGKERTGPKLDSEILSIRGNEADHIHSHVRDHNINLEF